MVKSGWDEVPWVTEQGEDPHDCAEGAQFEQRCSIFWHHIIELCPQNASQRQYPFRYSIVFEKCGKIRFSRKK